MSDDDTVPIVLTLCRYRWADSFLETDDLVHECARPAHTGPVHTCSCGETMTERLR